MKYGFIGCGNMAKAIFGGMIRSGIAKPDDILVSSKTEATRKAAAEKYGVRAQDTNEEVLNGAGTVFLCVKPQVLPGISGEIADAREETLFVSILAGKTIEELQELLGGGRKIVRVMPNTPALVGEAMSAACASEQVTEEERTRVMTILRSLGRAEWVPEAQFSAVTAVSGSSPAYVFMMIEAMADGAVRAGMPRKAALEFAAQAVLGSAKMALESGLHPGALKDMVCSPAGTTIEAVAALEKNGFRNAVLEAERVCVEKSEKL